MKKYDRTIGYSPLQDVDRDKMHHVIQVNKKIINRHFPINPPVRILVAGAGQGDEAELIFEEFHTQTVGVDFNIGNTQRFKKPIGLSFFKQDLEHLAFAHDSFSLIYCYHVLEHVSDHVAVLQELRRVLSPMGVLFIGFPNRHRLISYIGSSQKVSLMEKIRWNLNDYFYRIRGKFENKYGAHAGFSEGEFLSEAGRIFQNVIPVRNEYMFFKYTGLYMIMKVLARTGLSELLFPSNYFVCKK